MAQTASAPAVGLIDRVAGSTTVGEYRLSLSRGGTVPAESDFHRAVLDNLNDGVYFVDRLRRITYWNRGAERLTGYSATEAVGRRCRDGMLNHCDAAGTVLCDEGCPLLAAIQDGRQSEAHVFLQHKDGSRRPVCVRAAALRDDAGRIVGAFETFHDDSRLAAAEEQADEMRRLALLDPLTGLHNRRFGEMTLAGWLAQWTRYARRFGVLFADIDCFKTVNDEFGHDVGDEVLRMVANTLSHGARKAM